MKFYLVNTENGIGAVKAPDSFTISTMNKEEFNSIFNKVYLFNAEDRKTIVNELEYAGSLMAFKNEYVLFDKGHLNIDILHDGTAKIINKGWISLEYERPEIGVIVCVLLKNSDYTHVGFRANGGWFLFALNSRSWIPNDKKSGVKITHWQTLPNR